MIFQLRHKVLIAALVAVALVGIGCWQLAEWRTESIKTEPPAELPSVTAAGQLPEESEGSFYPHFRLQREKVRSQQLELLQEIINNPNTDDTSKQSAMNRLLTITNAMEMELKAEGLLKARGFKEGVVIIQDSVASVIVSGPALDEAEEEQIKSQVAGVLKMDSRQVSLINRE
ncbi:MAG: SpoIIIAH-like family protein [Syntrophomonadaceae bacterium]|nr:SpoIIIAH-like family protein [Syntrophomonadaceae bacterium]